ncbi:hypothetical protein Q757_07220 [Oenococcus alcoholitolerans]|uniref:Uncharacterized protein n=1 Tax=Oenococcus alcoholitolerans TaxID=931074 RepID=A0ABR4XQK5_9LACO|nr:hypothetical protein Q757_07220 [Oenococcus alcoholitolerans]
MADAIVQFFDSEKSAELINELETLVCNFVLYF